MLCFLYLSKMYLTEDQAHRDNKCWSSPLNHFLFGFPAWGCQLFSFCDNSLKPCGVILTNPLTCWRQFHYCCSLHSHWRSAGNDTGYEMCSLYMFVPRSHLLLSKSCVMHTQACSQGPCHNQNSPGISLLVSGQLGKPGEPWLGGLWECGKNDGM